MAEVKFNGPLYKVTMTEYERGYGQRPMGERFFDNEQEARQFCLEYNRDPGTPDCYFRAEYSRVILRYTDSIVHKLDFVL